MSRDDFKQFMTAFIAAFPDQQHVVEELIAEGDKVAPRLVIRGTHQGAFWTPVGTALPTGNPITLTSMALFRLADGRIVEERNTHDWLRLLQQGSAEVRLPGPASAG